MGTSSAALITAAPNNHGVQGSFYGHHEISTGYVAGCFPGSDVCGRWISVWNTGLGDTELGWSQSLDKYGQRWSAQQQQTFDQFGNPGTSPYNGAPWLFAGWASDPSVAPATNPAYNNNNKRMLVSNIAASSSGGQTRVDDVVIAFSDNAGLSWQHASYVNVPGPGGGGGVADGPHIASNPTSPWDSYMVWDSVTDGLPYMRKVWFDSNGVFLGGAPPPPVIPLPASPHLQRPALGFGKLPAACTSGGEAVFVATANGINGANHQDCNPPFGGPRGAVTPQWYLTVYDVGWGVWHGPYPIADGTGSAECLGASQSIPGNGIAYNSIDPKIAVDPNTTDFWITHVAPVTGDPSGSHRVAITYGQLVCGVGGLQPTTQTWTSPPPCDPTPGGQCTYGALPDGGTAVQDEWEPAIGFAQQPGNPPVSRVVAYWYGTRDDINNYNTSVYMTYSENGAPFSNPTRIALQEPGENLPIPWPLIGQEWDYNDLGVDTGNGRFMAVWGGDGRTGATQTLRIESELLY